MSQSTNYSQTEIVCEKLACAGVGANSARAEYVSNSPLKESELGMNPLPYLFVFYSHSKYDWL